MDISERQKKLLKAIIQEFIETATAVSSLNLPEKYNLPISTATIRSEMKLLSDAGLLKQLHTSSGRIPTSTGMRYFIQELLNSLEEPEVLVQEEIKKRIHESRFNKEQLIRGALQELTRLTAHPSLFIIGDEVHYAGLASMFNIPEFHQVRELQLFMSILEDYENLKQLFEKNRDDSRVKILLGEEIGFGGDSYSIVFTSVKLYENVQGFIAVFGPLRMNYVSIIPAVDYIAKAISRAVSGW